jgi:hypothetical protein
VYEESGAQTDRGEGSSKYVDHYGHRTFSSTLGVGGDEVAVEV